ncbi:virulence protein E [Pandoraea pneumonica]|uniref:Virulence protein E n=1 Tax=Pandoraea pneumonica TaxID=2508299 RepID=A0A5E4WUB5_9BURK|nr:VapE domain-containing protein [Pandoraea pneumonica]VVE28438.1 virulence protein E [Pandoraea pneumonica]
MASIDDIRLQLLAAGHPALPEGHPIADDKHHRYGKGKKYWYALHEVWRDGRLIGHTGAYGCWSGHDNGATKFEWIGETVTADDLAAVKRRQEDVARAEAEKKAKAAKNASNRANAQWDAAEAHAVASAYFDKKQITPECVRVDAEGQILVPMVVYGETQHLAGLQKISPDGVKRFNAGMDKVGTACQLGSVSADDQVVGIAEGYATARSVRMALEDAIPVVVAFDAGGLMESAKRLRKSHPGAHLLFLADDDWKIEQRARDWLADEFGYEGDPQIGGDALSLKRGETAVQVRIERKADAFAVEWLLATITTAGASTAPRTKSFANAGRKAAHEAAAEVGNASVTYPAFEARGDRKLTDFNDLHVEEGLHVVRQQVSAAVLAAMGADPASVAPYAHLQSAETQDDPLYESAVDAVTKHGRATVGHLQKLLSISYARASRLLEVMEDRRIVTAVDANGRRKVAGSAATPSSAGAAGAMRGDGDEEEHWRARLRRADNSGAVLPALDNVFAILLNDPAWAGVLGFEQFSGRVMKLKPPPFDEGGIEGEWTDRDDARCVLWLGQRYGFSPKQDITMEAAFLVAERSSYHVVRDYLESVRPNWDRKSRLRSWLVDYLGVEDTEYARLVGFKWLLGAVGRVMRPGCKMDNILILEGKQDAGKSRTFATLFGQQWFTDAHINIGDKDTYVVMNGKWVLELAELDALNKADSSLAKKFFTTAVDTFRPPYGRRAIDVPRQWVVGGSVNFDAYLKDESGNRRYWPVKTADVIDFVGLARDRDQLWAEAFTEYLEWEQANDEAGGMQPTPWQVLAHEKPLFSVEQEARYEGDVYETMIARHLHHLSESKITTEQILADVLKLDISKWTPAEQRRVGKALKSIGWVRKRESTGAREWYYERPAEPVAPTPPPPPVTYDEADDVPL